MLDNKQCEAFLAVADTGSIDQAAKKLCMTASAVTLRLQGLEKTLGQLLVIRAKPCKLTQAGQKLYIHLNKILKQEQNLIHDLKGQSRTDFFKFVLASNADSLATWLLPVLQPYIIQKRILLEVVLDDQSHTYNLFEQGIVNACISIEPKPMKGCKAHYLGVMRYKLISTIPFKNHWFADGLTREALRLAPAVIFNQKDLMHIDVLTKHFGLAKGSYPFNLIPSSESFVQAIQLGLGYGMVPEFQLQDFQKDFKHIDLKPEFAYEVPLYWHHWSCQSHILHELTDHLVKYTRQILN